MKVIIALLPVLVLVAVWVPVGLVLGVPAVVQYYEINGLDDLKDILESSVSLPVFVWLGVVLCLLRAKAIWRVICWLRDDYRSWCIRQRGETPYTGIARGIDAALMAVHKICHSNPRENTSVKWQHVYDEVAHSYRQECWLNGELIAFVEEVPDYGWWVKQPTLLQAGITNKGGQNPPNESTNRPSPPQGSNGL